MAGLGMTEAQPAGARWALTLLFLIYVCNNMDRHLISILAEPIRQDLALSDTQLGMLSGLVFALFYTIFGIPAGWLADRHGRTKVIMIACLIWSACSALGGWATNFAQLAAARIGVGIGESGGSAPSYSLISAYYPPERRGAALGIYHLGSPVASLVVSVAGAWIAASYGWRVAVVAVSCPGILVALLLLLTVKDRGQSPTIRATPFFASIRTFASTPLLLRIGITAGLSSFTGAAIAAWVPAFLMRARHMPLSGLGSWYAIGNASAFGFGLWFGGFLADSLRAKHGLRVYALIPLTGLIVAIPFTVAAALVGDWHVSLMLWLIPIASLGMFLAPAVALVQNAAAPERRAISGALFLLLNYLIGSGLGPVFVGRISDSVKPSFGPEALGIGLVACAPVMLTAAWMQWRLSRLLPRQGDIE
ncbi:MAG: MFS transporter [Pseudomonadota bacterium]